MRNLRAGRAVAAARVPGCRSRLTPAGVLTRPASNLLLTGSPAFRSKDDIAAAIAAGHHAGKAAALAEAGGPQLDVEAYICAALTLIDALAGAPQEAPGRASRA
jgi:hypothetical protein